MPDVTLWRTMAITDRRRLDLSAGAGVDAVVARLTAYATAMAAARVDVVQVREYDLPDGWLRRCVAAMRAATRSSGLAVVVNDRAHVGVAGGAAGVHLRASSMPARRVRAVVPPASIIGRSVHGDEALAPDEMEGVDYVLFGTVFESGSKAPGHQVAGLAALARCCARVARPVLAVGGVTADNCRDVAARGASGIAAIGVFAEAFRRGGSALSDLVARVHEGLSKGEAPR